MVYPLGAKRECESNCHVLAGAWSVGTVRTPHLLDVNWWSFSITLSLSLQRANLRWIRITVLPATSSPLLCLHDCLLIACLSVWSIGLPAFLLSLLPGANKSASGLSCSFSRYFVFHESSLIILSYEWYKLCVGGGAIEG